MAKNSDKGVFDVTSPGKSAPSATSRPLITGHGPMLKDPMVSEKAAQDKPIDETPIVKASSKVIAPVSTPSEDKKSDTKEEPAEIEPEKEPKSQDEKPTEALEPDEAPAETATEDDQPDTAKTDLPTDEPIDESPKPKENGPTEEELARQQEIEGLIEAETYFLPIGQVTRRRNNRRAAVILSAVLLIALAGAYLVLDAGLIETSFKLPFNLINN